MTGAKNISHFLRKRREGKKSSSNDNKREVTITKVKTVPSKTVKKILTVNIFILLDFLTRT